MLAASFLPAILHFTSYVLWSVHIESSVVCVHTILHSPGIVKRTIILCFLALAPVLCPSGQFACASKTECIAQSKVCDGIYWDCGDGSDEARCTSQTTSRPRKSWRNANYVEGTLHFVHKRMLLFIRMFFSSVKDKHEQNILLYATCERFQVPLRSKANNSAVEMLLSIRRVHRNTDWRIAILCFFLLRNHKAPDYSNLNATVIAQKFAVGARVVRGKDWNYGFQDGGGVGTVRTALSGGFIGVSWDSVPFTFTYRMGFNGLYDLYLVSGNAGTGSVGSWASSSDVDASWTSNPKYLVRHALSTCLWRSAKALCTAMLYETCSYVDVGASQCQVM